VQRVAEPRRITVNPKVTLGKQSAAFRTDTTAVPGRSVRRIGERALGCTGWGHAVQCGRPHRRSLRTVAASACAAFGRSLRTHALDAVASRRGLRA
jgi:hypothetical protein